MDITSFTKQLDNIAKVFFASIITLAVITYVIGYFADMCMNDLSNWIHSYTGRWMLPLISAIPIFFIAVIIGWATTHFLNKKNPNILLLSSPILIIPYANIDPSVYFCSIIAVIALYTGSQIYCRGIKGLE